MFYAGIYLRFPQFRKIICFVCIGEICYFKYKIIGLTHLFVIFNSKYSRGFSLSNQRKRIKEYARTAMISASRLSVFPQKKDTILSSDLHPCLQTNPPNL